MRVLPKANDQCWCGSGKKYKRCHKESAEPVHAGRVSPLRPVPDTIDKPTWANGGRVERWDEPWVKSPDVIARMRRTKGCTGENAGHCKGSQEFHWLSPCYRRRL